VKRYFDPELKRLVEVPDDASSSSRETEGPLAESRAVEREDEFRKFLSGSDSDDEAAETFAKLLAKHRRERSLDPGLEHDEVMLAVAAKKRVVEFRREEDPPPLTRLDKIKSELRRAVRAALREERENGAGSMSEETRRDIVRAAGEFLAEGVRRHDPRMARDIRRHAAAMCDEECE
jgi:hypothetical protein